MIKKWQDQRTPALAIVARGDQIQTVIPDNKYTVQSQSNPENYYTVYHYEDNKWVCTCMHHQATKRNCIHVLAVKFQQSLKNNAEMIEHKPTCEKCKSANIVKNGTRKNKSGVVNRYLCKECGFRFTDNDGFKKRRSDPEKIALALDLYFRGLSVRKVAEHFQQVYNLHISHMTVYRWIYDYSKLASEWMDKQQVPTGKRWHIDETMVKVDGSYCYLWNVLDSESRYLLAIHVSKHRGIKDARQPIKKAKKATGDRPHEVLTDGLKTYPQAIVKELGKRGITGTRGFWSPHQRVPSIKAPISNNRIERFHGTEKERVKVMRGFDGEHGCANLMEGFRVHYNLVKNHQALGCTPCEATGKLSIDGFRWHEIIKKATI